MIQDYWFSNDNFRKVTGKEPGVRREERELGVKSEGSEKSEKRGEVVGRCP